MNMPIYSLSSWTSLTETLNRLATSPAFTMLTSAVEINNTIVMSSGVGMSGTVEIKKTILIMIVAPKGAATSESRNGLVIVVIKDRAW